MLATEDALKPSQTLDTAMKFCNVFQLFPLDRLWSVVQKNPSQLIHSLLPIVSARSLCMEIKL